MSTWFDQQKKVASEVKLDASGINTTDFIQASESLVKLFDLLGSSAFAIVQKDMTGNIEKIRTRQAAYPAQSETLENLVKSEATEKKRTATEGLLWLLRYCLTPNAVAALRRSLNNPIEELADSFTKAYNDTLKKFHSFVVRPLFALAMKACPYRKDFYAKLGADQVKVKEQLESYTSALERIVKQMEDYYVAGNYSKGL
ncbi:putative Glycolipid transfer protein HET-C2 [Taphrina deformans PYCC 5710]|uniref:Glycolipid transfer protein HET-C2 n=1 Tax=Taphrina deformans (strain PYCC 5710 / ATCC 11124 / CBS 356.35 / IMI 108563 / JCM 9778 / NBRC 8474) TaxID=1097556 RepID=R4XEB0_TAPDE|nr:putative Glycolipid transfer protein HET-C2 [Taphrina deformans PYCC 5710]|eukprot:CCG82806.1 putative Glycolipid transfer protein HET-C2 [Taphrina deformans PYCC 5710]